MLTSSPNGRGLVLLICFAVPSSWSASTSAWAQTARDAAKKHVNSELDKKNRKKRAQPRRRTGGRTPTRRDASASDTTPAGPAYTLSLGDDPELSRQRGRLPRRLFPSAHNYARFDLKFDGAYRGWAAQQYESAKVDIASYATWRIGVKGKFFKHLSLYRGYYESTGLVAPRNTKVSLAAKVGSRSPKAAKALGYIGLSFWKHFHPILRYEAQAFRTSATPKIPVCIVGRQDSVDATNCPRTMNELEVISSFETLVAGLRIVPSRTSRNIFATKDSTLPPFYVGLGVMSYSKPYQINVDGATLQEYLFDGRFRGAGLAFGTELGGGARRFFGGVDMQIGLGEVQLTEDFSLDEVTPDDWLIGYVQGNLRAGYRLVVFGGPPTVYFTPTASIGGASFHFVNTAGEADSAPTLNWDFLWSARASIEVAL